MLPIGNFAKLKKTTTIIRQHKSKIFNISILPIKDLVKHETIIKLLHNIKTKCVINNKT